MIPCCDRAEQFDSDEHSAGICVEPTVRQRWSRRKIKRRTSVAPSRRTLQVIPEAVR
jgi:hypothetical protein